MASSAISRFLSPPESHRISHVPRAIRGRRLSLFILSSPAVISSLSFNPASRAVDIPIFGLRNKIEKVEDAAVEIVKEGEKAAVEIVKEGEEAVEKEIEAAEEKLGLGFGFGGGSVQAAAVAGAEAVGVLVGVSIVNGILGPEGKNV